MTMRQIIVPIIVASVLALAGCSDKRHAAQLARAEALLDPDPDSALVVLNGISTDGMSGRNRALHALFRSIALDRTYVDLESDSIIGPALSYFIDHETDPYSMLAWYYAGRVSENARAYGLAVSQLLQAEGRAAKAGNHRYLGLIYRSLADINVDIFHFAEALEYRHKALDAFTQGNLDTYIPSAKIGLLTAYANVSENDSVRSYGTILMADSTIYSDPMFRDAIISALARTAYKESKFKEAKKYFKQTEAVKTNNHDSDDWYFLMLCYNNLHETDSIAFMASKSPVDSLSIIELIELGEYERAYYKSNNESLYNDSIIREITNQDVTLETNNYNKSHLRLLEAKNDLLIFWSVTIIVLLVILILFSYWHMRVKLRMKTIEQGAAIRHANVLYQRLEQSSAEVDTLVNKISGMTNESFVTLKKLINTLHFATVSGKISENNISLVYRKVTEIINSYRPGGESIKNLEKVANSLHSNIIARLRELPASITEKEIALATYFVLDFDIITICYLLNATADAVYNRKSRLKLKIKNCKCPDSNDLIKIIYR